MYLGLPRRLHAKQSNYIRSSFKQQSVYRRILLPHSVQHWRWL